ncbi:hypothetical protein ES332_A01G097200v1 [Gossypium tomentosum]|uniref:Uncharacterized protein n=1 Tax=Gossypium tomentosum TaxID=34277 RepID=A0A5D2RNL8_GOSTO|nr:hypothetical protein ES332_A01G097200v1 [Gossypium tomentosum]
MLQANFASILVISSNVADQAWYADSEVTAHITNDPTKFAECSFYTGSSTVIVEDLKTHKILLQGTESGRLYKFLPVAPIHAFNTTHEATGAAESIQKCDLDFQFTLWH